MSVRLGDICDMRSGGTPRRHVDGYFGGEIPWVTIADMSASDGVVRETAECITVAGLSAIGNRLFQAGTILLAMYGSVGKLAIAGRPLATSQAILGLQVRDPDVLDSRYLKSWLASIQPKLVFGARGVTQANISKGIVEELRIPVPTLPEQRRIANILGKADAIRRKRKEAVALTEQLLRSAFLEMFGDPITNPKGWPSESIDELCIRGASLVDGPFGSSLKPECYVDSGVKVVRNWNIYDDRFDLTEFKYVTRAKFEEIRRSEVLRGDILITTKGTVGDVCVAPDLGGPAVLSASGTVRLRVPSDATYIPEFVVGQMTTGSYKRYLHTFEAGSAQQYLNLSAIKKMRLIRPPIERQRTFEQVRATVRASAARASEALLTSDHLFASLVEQAFATRASRYEPSKSRTLRDSLLGNASTSRR
jgi:type I restriction enzyme, S subunit